MMMMKFVRMGQRHLGGDGVLLGGAVEHDRGDVILRADQQGVVRAAVGGLGGRWGGGSAFCRYQGADQIAVPLPGLLLSITF